MKTSQTHPLQIDSVSAGKGVIGLTFCPGKTQADSFNGPWDRDLDTDLQTIKDWGASTLVSLMEGHEFEKFQVTELGTKAEAMGFEWHHLPIKDVAIPDERFEASWVYSGRRLRDLLSQGQKIVIHCKGGLGRTGTIAGRLMIELGETADDAINAIRAARPGSIETFGYDNCQEDCVRRSKFASDTEYGNLAFGCLLGGAVGDAFGYEVEFKTLRSIQSQFGPDGITEPVYYDEKLIVSDDTQMTLFTMEGLLRSNLNEPDGVNEQIRLAYVDWLSTQTTLADEFVPAGTLCQDKSLWHSRAPGNTCVSALRAGGWGTPVERINDSKGCGGVMRVAPIGLIREWSPEQCFDVAARSAAITHGHPSGFWSAAAMAAIVRTLLDGEELHHAAERSIYFLADKPEHHETTNAIQDALKAAQSGSTDHTGNVEKLGEGWVGEEALAIALYAALSGGTFAEVLAIGANHDGDSDSTASIAGQLYGTWRGFSDLHHAWVRRLDVLGPVTFLMKGMIEGR